MRFDDLDLDIHDRTAFINFICLILHYFCFQFCCFTKTEKLKICNILDIDVEFEEEKK